MINMSDLGIPMVPEPPLPDDTGVTHDLKTWPPYFQHVADRTNAFELRPHDRPFKVGDRLMLREWDPTIQAYTGRYLRAAIYHVYADLKDFGLADGYCILSIAPIWMMRGRMASGGEA